MNKIQTTKANTTLRRFFNRMGGGGVKALGYKETVSTSGGGGGQSSGEVQALFDAVFGQTPYVFTDNENIVPFSEFLSEYIGPSFSGEAALYYKEKQPAAKAKVFEAYQGTRKLELIPDTTSTIMVQFDFPDGPLYQPVSGDVDLTSFPFPTGDHPTVLTGVTIPDKDYITCVFFYEESLGIVNAEKTTDTRYDSYDAGFSLTKEDDVWVWEAFI